MYRYCSYRINFVYLFTGPSRYIDSGQFNNRIYIRGLTILSDVTDDCKNRMVHRYVVPFKIFPLGRGQATHWVPTLFPVFVRFSHTAETVGSFSHLCSILTKYKTILCDNHYSHVFLFLWEVFFWNHFTQSFFSCSTDIFFTVSRLMFGCSSDNIRINYSPILAHTLSICCCLFAFQLSFHSAAHLRRFLHTIVFKFFGTAGINSSAHRRRLMASSPWKF